MAKRRAKIKSLDCILDYKPTKLELALENGLKGLGVTLGKPFYEEDYGQFNIAREAKAGRLKVLYQKILSDQCETKDRIFSNQVYPRGELLVNKIMLIDDRKYFYERLALDDITDNYDGISIDFLIYRYGKADFLIDIEPEKELMRYIKNITPIKKNAVGALNFILTAIKNYDSFLKETKN